MKEKYWLSFAAGKANSFCIRYFFPCQFLLEVAADLFGLKEREEVGQIDKRKTGKKKVGGKKL